MKNSTFIEQFLLNKILFGFVQQVKKNRPYFWLAVIMLLSIVGVYLPFLNKMNTIYLHGDGAIYMFIAKYGYHIPIDNPFTVPPTYFASHLPLYPLLIRIMTSLAMGNYAVGMLAVTAASSICAVLLFYYLLKEWSLVTSPFWTAVLFCFIPTRWLTVHSVGLTEALFYCSVFLGFIALKKNKTWLVVLAINLATLTRITGILLIPVFAIIYFSKKESKKLPWLTLGLASILGFFIFCYFTYGNFFAYFDWNLHHQGYFRIQPFKLYLTYMQDIAAAELFVMQYILYGLGTLVLWKRFEIFVYCIIFYIFHCFVYHHDMSRYFLSLSPFALLVAYDQILSYKACRFFFPFLIFFAYTHAWGFLKNMILP